MAAATATADVLTPAQVEAFKRDGYVIIRAAESFLTQEEVQNIKSWTDEVQAWPDAPQKYLRYYEDDLKNPGSRILSRIENFIPFHEGWRNVCYGKILQACQQLFGEPTVLYKEKINFKLPGGGEFKPHQDAQAGWDKYGSLHITVMVTVDKATVENGCLELVAGRHKEGLLSPMHAPLQDDVVNAMTWVPAPTDTGDVVLFDSYVPHRSAPNMTDAPRRITYITYGLEREGNNREQYFTEKNANFPQDCERDANTKYEYKV
eukprot:gnl/Hemi2/28494_TR9429_c1_g1_i1.p1 gnl/Hemi2/28494_TR9429_c1_g1~~gnl/Hemi2/28494_TR9429_c1_g1_i1.p1  ORF type:complete len:262 (+),score=80.49 gnl/Hemi2/28494_TR9429_c1_g1_i1:80-865(+)